MLARAVRVVVVTSKREDRENEHLMCIFPVSHLGRNVPVVPIGVVTAVGILVESALKGQFNGPFVFAVVLLQWKLQNKEVKTA